MSNKKGPLVPEEADLTDPEREQFRQLVADSQLASDIAKRSAARDHVLIDRVLTAVAKKAVEGKLGKESLKAASNLSSNRKRIREQLMLIYKKPEEDPFDLSKYAVPAKVPTKETPPEPAGYDLLDKLLNE